jgi:hypothetical protein
VDPGPLPNRAGFSLRFTESISCDFDRPKSTGSKGTRHTKGAEISQIASASVLGPGKWILGKIAVANHRDGSLAGELLGPREIPLATKRPMYQASTNPKRKRFQIVVNILSDGTRRSGDVQRLSKNRKFDRVERAIGKNSPDCVRYIKPLCNRSRIGNTR